MLELIWSRECAICKQDRRPLFCALCAPNGLTPVSIVAPSVSTAFAAASYDSPTGQAIRTAKARATIALMHAVGTAIAGCALRDLPPRTWQSIVPAPSPWSRRLRRGFDPASVLARSISHALGVPTDRALRVHPGPRQSRLNARQRSRNLTGRLRCRPVQSGSILLVDDVTTTGATAEACARKLIRAGASEVVLLVGCAVPNPRKTPQGRVDPTDRGSSR